MWARDFPNASNTGMLCVTAPTLDIDLLDTEAVDAAVALVQERFGGRGKILLRYRRPKVTIPFQADTPFKKIQAELVAPDRSACCPNKFPHIPQFLLIRRGLRNDADRMRSDRCLSGLPFTSGPPPPTAKTTKN